MTTAFQFQDMETLGPKRMGSASPAPPSIVSMASDMFASGFVDPEQFVPSNMTDLFEGALCDDGKISTCDGRAHNGEPPCLYL